MVAAQCRDSVVAAQNCAEVVAAQSRVEVVAAQNRAEATIADSLQQSEDGVPVAQVAAGALRLVPGEGREWNQGLVRGQG